MSSEKRMLRIGRPTVDPDRFARAVELIKRGVSVCEAARTCGVSRQTLTRRGALRSKLYKNPDAVFVQPIPYRPYGDTMMDILLSAIPDNVFGEVKEEIVQQMAVEILSGDKAYQLLRERAIQVKKRVMRDYHNKWGNVSLDAPLSGESEGLTLGDLIAA